MLKLLLHVAMVAFYVFGISEANLFIYLSEINRRIERTSERLHKS